MGETRRLVELMVDSRREEMMETAKIEMFFQVAKSVSVAWSRAGVVQDSYRGLWHKVAADGVPVLTSWVEHEHVSTSRAEWTCHVEPPFLKHLEVGCRVRVILVELARRERPTRNRPNGRTVAGRGAALEGLFTITEIGTELPEEHFYRVEVSR